MNYGDYLTKKRFTITSTSDILTNKSTIRLSKSLRAQNNEIISINPNLFNEDIKYIYSNETISDSIFTSGGIYPLLIYSNAGCNFNSLIDNYGIQKVNYYLEYLKNDKYDEVFSELTTDETQRILYSLYSFKTSVDSCFTNMIEVYENIFITIRYFYFLYAELKSNELQFNKYKEDSEILNNITKLKEYLKNMQLNMNELTAISIKAAKLEIKPEYLKYIQLYGVPYKTMFDKVLLQEIIDEMYNNTNENNTNENNNI
jgi:hypothetical protein